MWAQGCILTVSAIKSKSKKNIYTYFPTSGSWYHQPHMFWAKSIYCTVLTASGGIMGEDKTTACLYSLMAALLIASPRAMALGLQIYRPPCKLIHLSAFSIAPFFPSRLFSSMQTCSDAARLNNRGPKQMELSCPLPHLLPSPGLREHPWCRSSPWEVRTLTWPRVWGPPEHRGSAGGKGFCCLLTLGVKEQNEKEWKMAQENLSQAMKV